MKNLPKLNLSNKVSTNKREISEVKLQLLFNKQVLRKVEAEEVVSLLYWMMLYLE